MQNKSTFLVRGKQKLSFYQELIESQHYFAQQQLFLTKY